MSKPELEILQGKGAQCGMIVSESTGEYHMRSADKKRETFSELSADLAHAILDLKIADLKGAVQ